MRRTLAVLVAGLLLAPAAQAANKGPVFGLRAAGNPKLGYFVYAASPGGSKTGAVIVSNSGTAKGTVKLFTADATTGHTSGTVYLTDAKPKRAGAWVTLAQTSLTLAPGQFKRVPFTLRVPAGTEAGQWVGGIVAETSRQVAGKKSKSKASVQIKIRDLTIVAVQANVPGKPVVDFTIGSVKAGGQRGYQQVLVHLENTGNVLVKPTGTVTILDGKSGATVEKLPFTMDTFLPQTAIDYPVLLKKALAPGSYTASVVLNAGTKHFSGRPSLDVSSADVKQVFTSASPTQLPAASSSSGSSTPWALIAAAVAVVLLLLLLLWFLRMRKWRSKAREGGGTTFVQSTSARLGAPEEPAPVREPEPPREPEPEVAPPIPPVPSEPAPPPPAPEPAPIPAPESRQPRPPECVPHHFWEVAYDRGQLGGDSVWRFPHRCRNCGLEVLAADVSDASAQADQL